MSDALAVGNTLIAGTSGWRYTIRRVSDDAVVADGPHGVQSVSREELEANIADGRVRVIRT